jgi:beta-mannosidase
VKSNVLKYLFVIILPFVSPAQILEKKFVKNKWEFKKASDKKWLKASVPGTVHTDLFYNKLIPDPFYADNEQQLQWIENEDWEYQTTFLVSGSDLSQSHIELKFDGLDTHAKVYVNDSLILIADNMFRSWKSDVKKYVHKGKNKLHVVFESAVKRGKAEAKKLAYTLPGDEKVFTRKAQYQYGWDWGPRFVTCGIWKNVTMLSWSDARILNVKLIQQSLSDTLAELEFVCEIQSDVEANAYLEIMKGNKIDFSGQIVSKVKLKKGIHTYSVFYNVKNPQRWWSNGLGFPTLYNFEISLSYDSRFLDRKRIDIGLRTIELIQDKDSIGKSFYFKLNGVPVFMKGANYIPQDNFLPRLQEADYSTIIKNAVDANMNMLRVWGGGVYADDAFYTACDKNGILVWQDFMFACAMYPGDDHFIENVAEEVIGQVERLRNHPSIALWCGNNEVDEGWKNWEWQKQYHYSEKDSSLIVQNNEALFNYFIKDIVTAYDGSRAYWPSSPSIGWGHKESLQEGDSHYWGVWWGMETFEMYEKKVGRFMSEYGFQGMPALNTLSRFGVFDSKIGQDGTNVAIDYDDEYILKHLHDIDSVNLNAHQKHPTGYKTITTYMERDYIVPKKINDYAYVSQLLQAKGMKIAIEAHRRAKPYCMGTLYWQMNDCWPVTSWSSVDYYDHWKASHYQAKRSFNEVIVSIVEKDDSCFVYVVSDKLQEIKAELLIGLYDFTGKALWSEQLSIVTDANTSKQVYCFDKNNLKGIDLKSVFLRSTLTTTNGFLPVESAVHYFVKPKELVLARPNFEVREEVCEKTQCFTIISDVLMKDICITFNGEDLNLSDNYFDLLPGEGRIIYLPEQVEIKNLENKIAVKSLFDMY